MMNRTVPSFRLSPYVHNRVNSIRYNIDAIGVTMVRLFLPLIHNSSGVLLLNIYNIMAWVTILTIDSSRVPEFTSTRSMQRKAWRYWLTTSPIALLMIVSICWLFQVRLTILDHVYGQILGIAMAAYMDELLFRNILQPFFRKTGVSSMIAIFSQSILYAFAIYLQTRSLALLCMAFVIGVINGQIVYKYRSLWPVFMNGLIWRLLFL